MIAVKVSKVGLVNIAVYEQVSVLNFKGIPRDGHTSLDVIQIPVIGVFKNNDITLTGLTDSGEFRHGQVVQKSQVENFNSIGVSNRCVNS